MQLLEVRITQDINTANAVCQEEHITTLIPCHFIHLRELNRNRSIKNLLIENSLKCIANKVIILNKFIIIVHVFLI